jgi:sugar phosphate isomerase/epimerase
MGRPVALFTGQWTDVPIEELAAQAHGWGFEGLELMCAGDHFDVDKAVASDAYLRDKHAQMEKHKLRISSLNSSLVSQCICDDPIDDRHKAILSPALWGDGRPEGVRQRCAEELKKTVVAARRMGLDVVKIMTGSSIWSKLYFFPPVTPEVIEAGFKDFADRFNPILDVCDQQKVRLAFEAHPTSIAYDIVTAERALAAIGEREAFGFNFDPSHLVHQLVDPVLFIERFAHRIYGVHVKDTRLNLNGRNSILGSHLPFGDARRGWDFCSAGRGDVKWDLLFRALNRIGYGGWLGIEWEDPGMDRQWGVREALAMVRRQDFPPAHAAFDAVFTR